MNLIARLARIKAAQAELIGRCGGIDGAVAALGGNTGRSTVGRWNNPDDATLMTLDAMIRLEAATHSSCMTAALAEINGRRLADPDPGVEQQGNVMARHAEAIIHAGELMAAGAAAFADGKVTPNEATTIDRAAAQLEHGLSEYRKALAGVKAAGGLKIVNGDA
jgi:hypothetical protein